MVDVRASCLEENRETRFCHLATRRERHHVSKGVVDCLATIYIRIAEIYPNNRKEPVQIATPPSGLVQR